MSILSILINLYTVPYFTRGFQDDHFEKAKAVGSIVSEDPGASKKVCGLRNGGRKTGQFTPKVGGLRGSDSSGKRLGGV